MNILDSRVREAVEKGIAMQVVLADPDGFVLDNSGYVYDPDELVSIFMSTQMQMEEGVMRFDFGKISEYNFRLVGTEMTVACRRVFWPDGGCIVVVVVPVDSSYNLIIRDGIRSFVNYMKGQRSALRKA